MFDVSKLTLDEVGAEVDKTINKLGRLQALYSAMLQQDHDRVKKLIQEYNQAKFEAAKEKDEVTAGSDPDTPTAEGDGSR